MGNGAAILFHSIIIPRDNGIESAATPWPAWSADVALSRNRNDFGRNLNDSSRDFNDSSRNFNDPIFFVFKEEKIFWSGF